MTRPSLATTCGLAAVALLALVLAGPITVRSQSAAPEPAPRNADEFDKMFRDNSNWGRWGKDDELGALNLITPAKRKQAFALVKDSVVVPLASNLTTAKAADDPNGSFDQTMGPTFQTDTYRINGHSFVVAHIDALCHYDYKGLMYNGIPMKGNSTAAGCAKLGVQHLKGGIITRAVLIDIPRLKGLPYLEPGTPVFTEDIEAWEKKVGVKVTAGDAILLNTGRWARRAKLGAWKTAAPPAGEGSAGFDVSVGPWLRRRDIAVAGSDGALEVIPNRPAGVPMPRGFPLHTFLIAGMGVPFLDVLELDTLAETAARLKRWEFMLMVAPIPITGGTGGPINPLAIF